MTPRFITAMRPATVLDSGLVDRSPTRRRMLESTAVRTTNAGTQFPLGSQASIEVLYPPVGAIESLADEEALVLRVTIGDFSALLMSDSG